ncbi:MAG TPA: polysaccharide deacetylase family protein [Acidimicrobiales bacterium]
MTTRRLSLTFDNGPTPGVTADVLDLLAERQVAATFFVVGQRLDVPAGRRLAERAVAEGHWVGNHGLTHTVPLGELDAAAGRREIDETQRRLAGLEHPDRLFRPFATGGAVDERLLSPSAVDQLVEGRYTCVLWNSIPHDWDEPDRWVDRALADVDTHEHTVVVVHDVDTGAMGHLPTFLDRLAAAGVEIVQPFADDCVPIRRGVKTGAFPTFPSFPFHASSASADDVRQA